MTIMLPRQLKRTLIPAVLLVIFFIYVFRNQYQLRNTLSYATRPLWDRPQGPEHIITHYYSQGMQFDEHTCQLHGWKSRPNRQNVVLFDSVLMSSELDLLEIRLNELDAVVDKFFIVESNATFTGMQKQTYFADNRARFANFDHKIVYRFVPDYMLRVEGSDNPWDVEANTRRSMTRLLSEHISKQSVAATTLLLMSDVDEIPSQHTLNLLRACDFGPRMLHLQLRNYLYSFEWFLDITSWRASVHEWRNGISSYTHSLHVDDALASTSALADAGWHCSYCFRTLEEFAIKMQGFSHSDRIGGDSRLLDPQHIQNNICNGRDIFGMFPEAYNYADFLHQLNLQPSTTAVGLPRYLIENADHFRFLLPGGCQR